MRSGRRRRKAFLCLPLLLIAAAAPATQPAGPATQPTVNRPPPKAIPVPHDSVTDEEIGVAIKRAAHVLVQQFSSKTYLLRDMSVAVPDLGNAGPDDNGLQCGANALAVYALMQAGIATNDPRLGPKSPMMSRMIDAMKRYPCTEGKVTYARGIRATALAVFNRPEDRDVLVQDVKYLLQDSVFGGYRYQYDPLARRVAAHSLRNKWGDNSNSQYGLLGVWSGAEAGIEIPPAYWEEVETHWNMTQLPNGMWGYLWDGPAESTMTAAGITSLTITHDYLEPPRFHGEVGRDPFTPALRKGLEWWESADNYLTPTKQVAVNLGYVVYGIERVGLATGFKYFGTHDWYREMAGAALNKQLPNGSWNNDYVITSYILAFLARARHPILMNKLRFDKVPAVRNRYWDNRPRDLAGLTKWASSQLERPLNWQIVNLERVWWDWCDSPVLYLASHRALDLGASDVNKLRDFVNGGGLLFLHTDGDEKPFSDWAVRLGKKLFPQYEMQDVPRDHPLYDVQFKLHGRPPLKAISNGSRLLVVLCPTDVARYWHVRDDKLHGDAFRFGLNLFLYAGGKRDWRNRLDVPYLPQPTAVPVQTVSVARVQYAGNWDPEPYAWERERRTFQYGTSYGIDLAKVKWDELDHSSAAIAHLTGTARYDATSGAIAAMKKYIENGGVLLIDACGGSAEFAKSMRTMLAVAFPGKPLQPLVPGHPLLIAGPPGMLDLTKRKVRPFVFDKVGADYGGFEILSAGKGHVIFSSLDLTSGFLGTNTWGIWGYEPGYAQSFTQNLVFWTLDGQKD